MIEYGLIFLTGLLTSLHCIGMCGAIILAYSANSVERNGQNVKASGFILHAAYNGGRIFSYALVGAVVGLVGVALASIRQIGEVISIVGGGVMIIAGIAMADVVKFPTAIKLGGASNAMMKLHGSLLRERTVRSKLLLGFLTPLLPCGILYPMIAKAAVAGSVLKGATTMLVFGLGMAPSLMLLGSVSSFFSARMRKGSEILAAITIILMGVILILRGFHIPYLNWMSAMSGEEKCPGCEG